jgi:hypothetical protein
VPKREPQRPNNPSVREVCAVLDLDDASSEEDYRGEVQCFYVLYLESRVYLYVPHASGYLNRWQNLKCQMIHVGRQEGRETSVRSRRIWVGRLRRGVELGVAIQAGLAVLHDVYIKNPVKVKHKSVKNRGSVKSREIA